MVETMKKKQLSALISMTALALILALVFYITEVPQERSVIQRNATNEAEENLTPPFPQYPLVKRETFTYNGEIAELERDGLKLRISLPVGPQEIKVYIKKIIVTENTKILRRKIEVKEEGGIIIPTVVSEEPIQLTDLKAGDPVSIISKENIREKDEIVADQIIISELVGGT